MFTKDGNEARLDREIARQLEELKTIVSIEEYDKTLNNVERLQKLKEKSNNRPSPDTMLLVASNLLGIAMIIRHENMNVITSKALGFVNKPK